METKVIEKNGISTAVVWSDVVLIKDTQSALDLMMTIKYETDCTNIALNKEAIVDDFFVLSTGMAGEILQKFMNYGIHFAIYGDFSGYTSKALHDFIYESNNGHDFCFVATEDEAVDWLCR